MSSAAYGDLLDRLLDSAKLLLNLKNISNKLDKINIEKKKLLDLYNLIFILSYKINFDDKNGLLQLILEFLDEDSIIAFKLLKKKFPEQVYIKTKFDDKYKKCLINFDLIINYDNKYIQKERSNLKKIFLQKWVDTLDRGDLCDAIDNPEADRCTPRWYSGIVIESKKNEVKIHFDSWNNRFDEWISRENRRLLPLYTKTNNWKKKLKINSIVEVRNTLTNGSTYWHKARVTAYNVYDNIKISLLECNKCNSDNHIDNDNIYFIHDSSQVCDNNTHIQLNKNYNLNKKI